MVLSHRATVTGSLLASTSPTTPIPLTFSADPINFDTPPVLRAVQYIRRMRGSQPQLLRASDHYYVVEFINNAQGKEILARELLAASLARMMGLPVPSFAIVDVPEALISLSTEMVIEYPRSREPCLPGPGFGSQYPSHMDSVR